MTQDTSAFYALDHGTVSTSASLIAPVDGRYRLLASATAPAGIDPEALLEDLAWRVTRSDASVVEPMAGWRDLSRLEVRTGRPPRACLVAASARTGDLLERAFSGAGWHVSARFFEPRPDVVALGEACLRPDLDAVVVGGRDDAHDDEREHMRLLWPLAGSLARMRDDLAVIACGPFAERPERIPDERLFSLPEPDRVPATAESMLRQAASQVGWHLSGKPDALAADGRAGLRTSMISLAALIGERVEGIEIGASAGSRSLSHPDGEARHAVISSAALLPASLLDDDQAAADVVGWLTLRGDPAGHIDRLRELVLLPWSAVDEEGTRLRLAALRAALGRLQRSWEVSRSEGRADDDASDVMILTGGGFSAVPAAAAALALIDSVRRPGAATILHDHAHVLSPLGALPVEDDRRRLLADLMDDILLPIGSAVQTGTLSGKRRSGGTMAISSTLGSDELHLEPGLLRLVDLPPGIVAQLEIDPGEGAILGAQGQPVSLEAKGGLGGLLVDTRDTDLPLPGSGEARRAQLEAWERPIWPGPPA